MKLKLTKNLFPKPKPIKQTEKMFKGICKYCDEEFRYTAAKKYKDICGICMRTRKPKL